MERCFVYTPDQFFFFLLSSLFAVHGVCPPSRWLKTSLLCSKHRTLSSSRSCGPTGRPFTVASLRRMLGLSLAANESNKMDSAEKIMLSVTRTSSNSMSSSSLGPEKARLRPASTPAERLVA